MWSNIKYSLINSLGWRTKRKLVVIQSDDWGSIRMPSNKVRSLLEKVPGIIVDDAYNKYDTLASEEDLEVLFESLSSVKDLNGNHAVISANCVMANPNFEQIKESGFKEYSYYSLEETFNNANNLKALSLWKEGESNGLFKPQFHGREHVNVPLWLRTLRSGHEGVLKAFENNVFGMGVIGLESRKPSFQASWDFHTKSDSDFINNSIEDGLQLFVDQFNKRSLTAIAPSYTWSTTQESLLYKLGVKYMQGIMYQKVPSLGDGPYSRKLRFMNGQHSQMGYQMRNSFFEPSLSNSSDSVSLVLTRISNAFRLGKPAVIGSHRLNFIGSHDKLNRSKSIKQLNILLKEIVLKWPDVEFVSTDELANIMDGYREAS